MLAVQLKNVDPDFSIKGKWVGMVYITCFQKSFAYNLRGKGIKRVVYAFDSMHK
jgi:hypothetical protein